MSKSAVIAIHNEKQRLRRKIRRHFQKIGFTKGSDGELIPPGNDKETYRNMHSHQRSNKLKDNKQWIGKHSDHLIKYFASGDSLDVARIASRLECIQSGTWQSNLFRLATYYWRIPISEGYGRRMRFLVWDDYHDKLIGIFAIGDAVFNLKVRDEFIGWDHNRRADAMVNLMDAYALGAVPPYNQLLGGKLIASLIQTREVVEAFYNKYNDSVGVISGKKKKANLVAVTTTSALGRSSIYNRLKLGGQQIFKPIGYTTGWGHFHFSNELFEELHDFLVSIGDHYPGTHQYGQGPNYRLRVIKKALVKLGMNESLARHGLAREVFFCSVASNAVKILNGDNKRINYKGLATAANRSVDAIDRWVIPRSERMPGYREWKSSYFLEELFTSNEVNTIIRKPKVSK